MTDDDPRIDAGLDRLVPEARGSEDWPDVVRRAAAGRLGRTRLARATRAGLGLAGATALVVLLALLLVQGPTSSDEPQALVGSSTPAVTLSVAYPDPTHGIDAPQTELASLRGQVVVLAFLDDRCERCATAADLIGYVNQSQVAGLAVATGVSPARARALATQDVGEGHRAMATASDTDGSVARAFGVTALPTLVILDRSGSVAEVLTELPAPETLLERLEPLLRSSPPVDAPIPPPAEPHLTVFDDPARAPATIPGALRPEHSTCAYAPGSLRVAASDGAGRQLIVGHGLGRSIVQYVEFGGDGGGSLGCGAPRTEALRQEALRKAERDGHLGVMSYSSAGIYAFGVVILDGYTEIEVAGTTYPVEHNGFIGSFRENPGFFEIRGPAGTHRVPLRG